LQCALTQCHDAIFVTDQTGVISCVNPAFEKLTSYSSMEAVGKDMSVFIAAGPQSDRYRGIGKRILQQRAFSGPVQLKKKSEASTVTPT
jgi:PAS domain S-box-containing protein